ncbi:MAG TPA: SRPBCC domain-containing protein [Actinophytocola sp.]|nr:SRPBCC domain-containing protein [Actinophytocola sp.]
MPETTETLPDGRIALRFARRLAHPREKVWRALTETGRLREWFVDVLDYDRSRLAFAPGATLTFAANGFPDSHGEVTTYQPPALLEYTWGEEVLRFELTADGAGCLLVFTNVVDGPETAAAVASGWSAGLGRLADALG